jgi:DNA invertase Pin-like site-specific DNA recombinase
MTTPDVPPGQPLRVIGYIRVSTSKQDVGPEVQISALEAEARRQGWQMELRREEAASAKSMDNRPVLAQALADLKAGRADVLAVSKQDRLSRSTKDYAELIETARRQGWAMVTLDMQLDTTTPSGEFVASVMMSAAQYERRRLGERTSDAMQQIKASTGKHMGRKAELPLKTALYVHELKGEGLSLRKIADRLTAEGWTTASGGKWHASTVKAVLESVTLQRALEEQGV